MSINDPHTPDSTPDRTRDSSIQKNLSNLSTAIKNDTLTRKEQFRKKWLEEKNERPIESPTISIKSKSQDTTGRGSSANRFVDKFLKKVEYTKAKIEKLSQSDLSKSAEGQNSHIPTSSPVRDQEKIKLGESKTIQDYILESSGKDSPKTQIQDSKLNVSAGGTDKKTHNKFLQRFGKKLVTVNKRKEASGLGASNSFSGIHSEISAISMVDDPKHKFLDSPGLEVIGEKSEGRGVIQDRQGGNIFDFIGNPTLATSDRILVSPKVAAFHSGSRNSNQADPLTGNSKDDPRQRRLQRIPSFELQPPTEDIHSK
jgi:hypothetical protein